MTAVPFGHGGWVVVRQLRPGTWHVVSNFTFPTRREALAGLDFVRTGIRGALRAEYGIARLEPVTEPEDGQ